MFLPSRETAPALVPSWRRRERGSDTAAGQARSAAADASIVRATLEVLLEDGYRGLTMEQVRSRAGVGKATLYRRYGSKQELVPRRSGTSTSRSTVPDTGSVRAASSPSPGRCWPAPSASGSRASSRGCSPTPAGDPEMHAIFYDNLVARGGR